MYWISIKILRAKVQNTDYGYEVYPLAFRFIRCISIYFTWLLIQTKCKPNTITIIGALLGVLSGLMFALHYVGAGLAMAAMAIIADFSDGEVSRFHGTTSKEGTYLDSIHHFVVQPFFIAGIVIWCFEINGSTLLLGAGMVSAINSIILPLSITAAVDVAVLKHILRHVRAGGYLASQEQFKKNAVDKNSQQMKKFYRKAPGILARFMDFPYVIIIMGVAATVKQYTEFPMLNFNSFIMEFLIYAYAFLSTMLICIFIWNIISARHIDKLIAKIVIKN